MGVPHNSMNQAMGSAAQGPEGSGSLQEETRSPAQRQLPFPETEHPGAPICATQIYLIELDSLTQMKQPTEVGGARSYEYHQDDEVDRSPAIPKSHQGLLGPSRGLWRPPAY